MADQAYTPARIRPGEGSLRRPHRAGGAGEKGNVVYMAADGDVEKARANAALTSVGIGILVGVNEPGITTCADGDAVSVVTFGPVHGFSGLTPGALYYVSTAVAGKIQDVKPTGAGSWTWPIGYAEDAQTLFVLPGVVLPVSNS